MKKLLPMLVLWFALAGAALATVNINTATKEELSSLKGIGEKKAQAIIDYRKKHGDFKSVDDLQNVDGISPATLKQIRTQISVSGKTTSDEPVKPAKSKVAKSAKPKTGATTANKGKVAAKSTADDKSKLTLKNDPPTGAIGKKSPPTKAHASQLEKKLATK